MEGSSPQVSEPLCIISGCRILAPGHNPAQQNDIHLSKDGKILSITPHIPKPTASNVLDATNYLLAPSLCHAHIHLDKCFLLSDPKFADLEIVRGDFAEAMKLTSKAKARFTHEDLIRRGKWLVAESIAAGVTHMRAFVEVDLVVEFKCLDAAIELKHFFAQACEIQICAFAQDPIFSAPHGEENRRLMEQAVRRQDVEVVGSTPYVEDDEENTRLNIEWATQTALNLNKHLDLHLDYNLDSTKTPLTHTVIRHLNTINWPCHTNDTPQKTISLGHCTRLTLLPHPDLLALRESIQVLPLTLIGLPTSDIYIQGRPPLPPNTTTNPNTATQHRPRGTLQIPHLIRTYNIPACISINNVGNAFTPHGNCDPLSIASMGIGIYHAGTKDDAGLLYECVSSRAKVAIGFPEGQVGGGEANFALLGRGDGEGGLLSRARGRRTLQEVVCDPPRERKTVFRGRLVGV
jgi:hypothetical protein